MPDGRELHAVLEIELVYPYKFSCETVIRFVNEWNGRIVSLSTYKSSAIIALRWQSFKTIWGKNPRAGIWPVPEGAEDFMTEVKVLTVASF